MSRRRGSGSLYKQPGQRVWTLQYYVDGRQKKESSRTEDRAEAQRLLNKRLYQIQQGEIIRPTRVRVEELYADLVAATKAEGRDPYEHAKRWKYLQPVFGARFAGSVTSSEIAEYRVARQQAEKPPQPSTINREVACLRRMFKLGAKQTPPKISVVPYFKTVKENNTRKEFLDPTLYDKFVEEAMKEGLWMRAIFEIGYKYGWRRGEVLPRVRQADFAANELRLFTSKNGEGRVVSLTPTIRGLLLVCALGKGPDDFLFTRTEGRYKGQPVKSFRDAWERLRIAVGLPKLRFHDLRRTAARNLRRAGVAEGVIMKINGWKTRSVFERYNIVSQEDIKQAMARLENDPRFDPYPAKTEGGGENANTLKPQ